MNDRCIVVFTSRGISQMVEAGGSQAWTLDPKRARGCAYLICTWNPTGEFARSNEGRTHGEAFLIAPISAVELAPENPERYIIRFDEFARISIPNAWNGQRNPVWYASLSELGIIPSEFTLEASTASTLGLTSPTGRMPAIAASDTPLNIDAAKRGLAAYFQINPEQIEITIRG